MLFAVLIEVILIISMNNIVKIKYIFKFLFIYFFPFILSFIGYIRFLLKIGSLENIYLISILKFILIIFKKLIKIISLYELYIV